MRINIYIEKQSLNMFYNVIMPFIYCAYINLAFYICRHGMLTDSNKSKSLSIPRVVFMIISTVIVCAFISTIIYHMLNATIDSDGIDRPFILKKWVYIYIITVLPALVGNCRAICKHNLNTR